MSRNTVDTAALINACQGLVRSIAWKIHQKLPSTVDLDDLIGFGQVGLAEAARDFDAGRGVQFSTYAYYRVRGAILDGLSSMTWFSRAEYASGQYERTANDLLQNGPPQDDHSVWFSRTTRTISMSFLLTHWCDGEVPEPTDHRTPGSAAEAADLQCRVRSLVEDLPSQEQSLIRSIYFEGLTIKDAGERIGISKAWASRLHARTLDSLALRLTENDH